MATQTFLVSPSLRTSAARFSNARVWTGRSISLLLGLFLLLDGVMKLTKPAPVLEATVRLGYPEAALAGTGILLLLCTVLYMIPRTAILGAALLTGYLGGALAIQVRAGSSWFESIFPALFGILVWFGLWLRDGRLAGLLAPVSAEDR